MALIINDNCIRCHSCIPLCPSKAIYKAGEYWTLSEGTILSDVTKQKPLNGSITFIVPEKCFECVGINDEPICSEVCPVSASEKIPENTETMEQLLHKKKILLG